MARLLRPATALLLALCLPPAFGWGAEGHRIVAQIAADQLRPAARSAVAELLSDEPEPTLAGVANWADEVRSPGNSAMHYLNFPDGDCAYLAKRDCLRGRCVVAAIERAVRTLKRRRASREQRQVALKQLVHFVGDIHQPLHAGLAEDRGGNTVQLRWRGAGSNLHQLWDSGLIDSIQPDWQRYVLRLRTSPASLDTGSLWPADWAMESCRIVAREGFYPDSRKPGLAYRDRWQASLDERLNLAGLRLAAQLNALFPG